MNCFHILAIMNAAINMGGQIISLRCNFCSFGYIPEIRLLNLSSSILNYLKNPHTIFIADVPYYIPTNSAHGFQFLYVTLSTYF